MGDIWNQNGDPILTDYALQIANVGRMIGQSSKLNPIIVAPQGQSSFRFYDHIGARYSGLSSGRCLFKPTSGGGYGDVTASVAGNLGTRRTTIGTIAANGDWYPAEDGLIYIHGRFAGTEVVYYDVTISDMDFDDTYLFNVIPDVNQDAFTACRISQGGSGYILNLPPRRPVASHGLDRWLSAAEIANANNNATASGAPYKVYQSSAVNAVADEFYRYPLPKEIRDALSGLSVGDTLPAGFLYLYDTSTKTIVDNVVFKKHTNNYSLRISSSTFNFASYVTLVETEANYSASPFVLITVGASVSNVLNNLTKAFMTQDSSTRAVMHHSQLDKVNPTYADSNDFQPGPSYVDNDDHIYLLSRFPLTNDSEATDRDPNKNAMLTDLVMGCTSIADSTAGKYVDPTTASGVASTGIYFKGLSSSYPSIVCPADNTDGLDLNYTSYHHNFLRNDTFPFPTAPFCTMKRDDSGFSGSISNSLLLLESGDTGYLNFLVPNDKTCGIRFGDQDAISSGFVTFNHTIDRLGIGTGSSGINIDASLTKIEAGLTVGIGNVTLPGSVPFVVRFSSSGTVASIENINGTNAYKGLQINCGATIGSRGSGSNGDAVWLEFNDENGNAMSIIEYTTASPYARFASASDQRLKNNIKDTDIDGLDIINNIPLRQFDWKDPNQPHQDIWYVAQEVEKVYPVMVSEGQDGYKLVGDACLIPILVKAIQQQQEQIDKLKKSLKKKKKK